MPKEAAAIANEAVASIPAAGTHAASVPTARKSVSFRKFFSEVEKEIMDSGLKAVSIDEIMKALVNIIEKARKDYDEINISEQDAEPGD